MKMRWRDVNIAKTWVRIENKIARRGLFWGILLLLAYGILYYVSNKLYCVQTGYRVERKLQKAKEVSTHWAEIWTQTSDKEAGIKKIQENSLFHKLNENNFLLCLFDQGKLVYWNQEVNEPDSVIYRLSPQAIHQINNRIVYPFVFDQNNRRLVMMLEVSNFLPERNDSFSGSENAPLFRIYSDHPDQGMALEDESHNYFLSIEPVGTHAPFPWVGIIAWIGWLTVVLSLALLVLKRMTIYNGPWMLLLLFIGLLGIWVVAEFSHVLPQNYPVFKPEHPVNGILVRWFGPHLTMGNVLIISILFFIYTLVKVRARYKLKIYFRHATPSFRHLYIGWTAISYGLFLAIATVAMLLFIFDHFAFKTVYETFAADPAMIALLMALIAVNATIPLFVLHLSQVFNRKEIAWIVLGMLVTGTVVILSLSRTVTYMEYLALAFFVLTLGMIFFQYKYRLRVFFTCYVGITAFFFTLAAFHDAITGNTDMPHKIATTIYNSKNRVIEGPYDYILKTNRKEWQQFSYYSFIKVEKQKIVDFGGRYVYGEAEGRNKILPVNRLHWKKENGKNDTLFQANNFIHYAFLPQMSQDKMVVVSYPKPRFVDFLSMFLHLFVLLWVGGVCLFGITLLLPKIRRWPNSLYQQVCTTIFLSVILSVLAVLIVVVRYVVKERDDISKAQLFTLFNTTVADFNTLFRVVPYTPEGLKLWTHNLKTSYWLDLNVYDESGSLLACSNPKALAHKLIPIRMNPQVFQSPQETGNLTYVEESVKGFDCFSFYCKLQIPGTDDYVFLHALFPGNFYEMGALPIVVNMMNIFSVVVFLSMVISGLFYRQIMKPIRLIQNSIRNIRYRQRIENSPYDKHSEIGQLLEQYNQTIDELAVTYTELARHERQDAWRMIARQMAHELKNPLTPIKLKAQMILHRRKTGDTHWDDKIDESLQLIVSQTEILANIITEFSSLGKINEKPPVRVNIDKMCRELISFYSCFHGVTIHYQNLDTSLYANVNYDNLWSVILNLISNAVSAVHAVKDIRHGHIILKVRSDGPQHIEISVSDNGCGIPKEEQPMIFAPNFTTKKNGSGLGLVISQQMVQAMKGRLYFESKEGVGTVFYIVIEQALPLDEEEQKNGLQAL